MVVINSPWAWRIKLITAVILPYGNKLGCLPLLITPTIV